MKKILIDKPIKQHGQQAKIEIIRGQHCKSGEEIEKNTWREVG